MVNDTPPSQDASTHQIWNAYLKEYRRYGPDTKAGRTHGRTHGRTDGRTVRLLYASQSSFGGIKREPSHLRRHFYRDNGPTLLTLSYWCLVMVERLFLAVPWGCLRFVIVVLPFILTYYLRSTVAQFVECLTRDRRITNL